MLESSIRRLAHKHGLKLQKYRSRNRELPSYGTYRLLVTERNLVVFGGNQDTFGASLEECERYILKH
jgi:hypothetical protein